MSTITPPAQPLAKLSAPTSKSTDYIKTLESKCGIVAGTIDSVIRQITGFSPLEEWVFKPLAGDWVALDKGASAWSNAANAVDALKQNYAAAAPQVQQHQWSGQSFDAFQATQQKLVSELDELPEACHQMSTMTSAISDAAKAVADLIALVINEVVAFAIEMLASLAVPVAGEVAMPAWIAKLAAKVATWSVKISRAIIKFGELVTKILKIVAKVRKVITKVVEMLKKLKGAKTLYETATKGVSTVQAAEATAKAAAAVGKAAYQTDQKVPLQ